MSMAVLDSSKPRVLKNDAEYEAAIVEIGRLLDEDVEPGSEGYDRLEFLSVLVEHNEEDRYPMGPVSPQQAVAFMLEQKGLDRTKRELSKAQAEGLRRMLGIPADILLALEG